MANISPPDAEPAKVPEAILADTGDWIRRFIKHFELHVLGASRGLPADASVPEMQEAAARAILQTYLDSGIELESAMELLGKVALESGSAPIAWNDELNERRFALIDKDIQGTLTPAENVELAGLTRIMRNKIDSEMNLPMKGARALHRKLLQLESAGQPE